ncbi:MAG TPA: transcription termination/antitermination NusG family protein [Gemmatales bacterium]|nr:transcription termination/antitermination NusG family protein [Gemmatales bacterium]
MPILPAEPDVNPADLLTGTSAAAGGARWWVLHVKPRQEKALTRQLLKQRIGYFLPVYARQSRVRRRLTTSWVPLFPGYLFLWGNAAQRLTALTTNRIVHVLEVPDQQQLDFDLRQLFRLLRVGAPVTPEQKLAPGDEVEIRSGPLAGLTGVILRTTAGQRFVVKVNFLQRGASVEVEAADVLPVT